MHLRKPFAGFIICFLLIGAAFTACSNKEKQKPNILFFFIDDLSKEWISCYGADSIHTPVIDNLAETGVKFTNMYSMPQCTPSRVTLLTGQYPFRNGWVNHYDVPRLGHGGRFDPILNPSFARMMREAGYATCAAGKWQINDFRLEPEAMVEAGFDEYCMWTGGENGGPSRDPSQIRYWDPYIHTREGSKTYTGQFGEDIFSDFIIDFMTKNKEKPMMIYYPMCLTHGPLTTTPLEPDVPKKDQHAAMVRYTDFILDKILKALDDLEIRDNTIVLWTTDNGTGRPHTGYINGKPVKGGKMFLTENGIAEPFIVNCPGIVPEGITTDALVDLSDFLPTFCELAGVEPDGEFIYDGSSFASLILGEKDDTDRQWIMAMGGHFAMLENDRIVSAHDFRDRSIRDKEYKVFVDTCGKIVEIIDINNDFYEQNNLINSDKPEVIAALEKFQRILDGFPDKDADPIYTQITEGSFYDHPAEALNKVARGGMKAPNKSPLPEGVK